MADYLDVLVLCAAPVDARPALNLAEEFANLEDEVRRATIPIRLRRVFPPTFEQLQRELSAGALHLRRPRVFHFLGHGEEDGLWFEKEDGSGVRVEIARLRKLFRDTPIDLALFNACWTDTVRVEGLCNLVVRDGAVRAAIGHGRPVEDESALVFARHLYKGLTMGLTVGQARQAAVNALAERGLPGSGEVGLRGDATLRLGDDLVPGERSAIIEDGLPKRGYLPESGLFCGRADDYLTISRSLGDRGQIAFGIWGIGGIGKTALAREVARRNAWRYAHGGAVWVDAREITPPTATGLLRMALTRLVLGADASDPTFGLARHLKAAPGLIVLDNLEALPEAEQETLARQLDQLPRNGSRVVLTARMRVAPIESLADARSLLLTRGLDTWSGAHYAYHLAKTKGIQALAVVPEKEGEDLVGPCARVSRSVSGHPEMIKLAVGIARAGTETLDAALSGMAGDLEERLGELLEQGLRLIDEDGRRLLRLLWLFPTGRLLPDAMRAACQAVERLDAAGPDGQKDEAPVEPPAWIDAAFRQLQRAAFLDYDQGSSVYRFHQTIRDYVARVLPLDPERSWAGCLSLLGFYIRYIGANGANRAAVDRCIDHVLVLMESVWDWRDEPDPDIDIVLTFLVDGLCGYFADRGLWQIGVRWLERAIELRRSLEHCRDAGWLAYELYSLALLLSDLGDLADARQALEESIQLLNDVNAQGRLAKCLSLMAAIEMKQGNPAEARRLLQESIAMFESIGDPAESAHALRILATLEYHQGNLDAARLLVQRSLEIDEPLDNRQGIAAALHLLDHIEDQQGNLSEARKLLRRSMELSRKLGDRWGFAVSQGNLAIKEFQQGNLVESRRLLREAIASLGALGDQANLAGSLFALARIEERQGDLPESRRLLERSIDLYEDSGDVEGLAAALVGLAELEEGSLHNAEARDLLTRAVESLERVGAQGGLANALNALARVQLNLGNRAEARALLDRCIAIRESIGDRRGLASALDTLGDMALDDHEFDEAGRWLERAMAISGELGYLNSYAISSSRYAFVKIHRGEIDAALSLAREAVRLHESIGSADAVKSRQMLAGVEELAASIPDRSLLAEYQELMGHVMATAPDLRIGELGEALEVVRAERRHDQEALLQLARSQVYWIGGDFRAAQEALGLAREAAGRFSKDQCMKYAALLKRFEAEHPFAYVM
jgi:tetratricopeptide (TPR) repeat protein